MRPKLHRSFLSRRIAGITAFRVLECVTRTHGAFSAY
jgi:hypothetical protein